MSSWKFSLFILTYNQLTYLDVKFVLCMAHRVWLHLFATMFEIRQMIQVMWYLHAIIRVSIEWYTFGSWTLDIDLMNQKFSEFFHPRDQNCFRFYFLLNWKFYVSHAWMVLWVIELLEDVWMIESPQKFLTTKWIADKWHRKISDISIIFSDYLIQPNLLEAITAQKN